MGIGTAWLNKPATTWEEIPAYQKLASFASNLPLSNAATERIIKRTTDYATYGAKGELEFQAVLQCVSEAIKRVPSRSTKKELVKLYGQTT